MNYENDLLRIILKNSITIDANEAWNLAKIILRLTKMKTKEEILSDSFYK